MLRSSKWFQFVLALFSGILLALAFPKFNLPWLAWIAPGLMLHATSEVNEKKVFALGFAAGMGRHLVSLYWFLLIPFPWHGLAAWLALSSVLSLFTALWCWLCRRVYWMILFQYGKPISDKPSLGDEGGGRDHLEFLQQSFWPLFCAAAWVGMEMTIARVLTGFPWNFIGASQFEFLSLIQIASITGVYGLSFLIVWLSVALRGPVITLVRQPKQVFPALLQVMPPVLLLMTCLLFGKHQLVNNEPSSSKLKIALIQPAIPQLTIWNPNEKTNRFLKLVELSRTALASKPDLLVWPETALPDLLTRNRYTQETISALLHSNQTWMVIGALDSRPKNNAPAEQERLNSAFLIKPSGDLVSRYHKQHLVIFGEYMPLAKQIPFLAKFRTAGAGTTPGENNVAFETKNPDAKFSTLICSEEIFGHEVCERVNDDTDFLLNLTNDGWFGESAAQWQHAVSALFRAVENHLPLVRCTNNGLTCWIDSAGRFHDILSDGSKNVYQAGFEIIKIPLPSKNTKSRATFYRQHGDWFGWSCVGLTALALIASLFPARQKLPR